MEYEGAACCESCVTKAQEEARRVHETEQQMRNLSTGGPPKPVGSPSSRGVGGVARGGGPATSTPGRGAGTVGGTGRGGAPAPIARGNTATGTPGSPNSGQKLSYKEQKELENSRVKCTSCQTQIGDAIFRFQGVPYCGTCAEKIKRGELSLSVVPGTTPQCSHCKRPITVLSFKTVDSKTYHTDCLTCNVCGISVVDFFQEKAGQILCEPHYQEIMKSRIRRRYVANVQKRLMADIWKEEEDSIIQTAMFVKAVKVLWQIRKHSQLRTNLIVSYVI